jgi:O-antigen/teichoic acid export membrane protein
MGLRKNALGLAAASATEYGLQLAIPMVLVRTLDPSTFGHYKFLWLMAGTALAWVPLFMPQALFYFLPRYKKQSSEVVTNALVYMLVTGALVALLCSELNPFLPGIAQRLDVETRHLSSLFLGLMLVVCLFDVLPTAVGMSHVQARTTAVLALVKSTLLVAAALLRPDLVWLALALVVVATLKLIALLVFIQRDPELAPMRFNLSLLRMQLAYAAPFAFGNALFLMRSQGDQWIVASSVDTATYAVFSVASVLGPIGTLIRQPLYSAMMPKLNAAFASARLEDVATLIGKVNGATSLILIPVIGGLFAISHELVSFVYTPAYADAAPVMQIYLIGMLANSFAAGHVLPALNLGKFATINNAVCLLGSLAISYLCLKHMGLFGASLGSVLMLYVGELWSGIRVARVLGVGWQRLMQASSLYRSFAALILSVIATFISGHFGAWSLPMTISIKSVVFSFVYISAFMLLGGLSDLKSVWGKQYQIAP